MHDRRFRFGIICQHDRSAKEFTELARKAEALGYSTLFVPDHFVDHELAPTVALAHAAAVTDTLRIGSLVLGNDYKHPVVLAAKPARSTCSRTAGSSSVSVRAGRPTTTRRRDCHSIVPVCALPRLAESITVLKGLFADGPLTFHGEHYRITDLDGKPKPVQRPHPPFMVGGAVPRSLRWRAREAQIVGINANLRSGVPTAPDAGSP